MKSLATLAAVGIVAIAPIPITPASSADLIGTYPVWQQKSDTTLPGRPHVAGQTKAWKAPPNMFVTVSARYCEETVCEPVTLWIWSGDTFVMDRLGRHREHIRIANIETANVAAVCPAEAAAAQEAKLRLMSLLQNKALALARVSGEKDNQSAAFVTVSGHDIGKTMMDLHDARPYETPRRPWC